MSRRFPDMALIKIFELFKERNLPEVHLSVPGASLRSDVAVHKSPDNLKGQQVPLMEADRAKSREVALAVATRHERSIFGGVGCTCELGSDGSDGRFSVKKVVAAGIVIRKNLLFRNGIEQLFVKIAQS
jgi:hypothetical protein